MIKYVYATKNVLSGNFGKPEFEDYPKESANEVYAVACKEAPADLKVRLKELDLYYLGEYDTKTGELKNSIEFLVSLGQFCEVPVDGKESRKDCVD